MAKVRLEGFKEFNGTIDGNRIHTVKLHLSEPFCDNSAYGRETSTAGIQYDKIPNVFGFNISTDELTKYCYEVSGKEIDVSYNKNGKVCSVALPKL